MVATALAGVIGYRLIEGWNVVDSLYMTFIGVFVQMLFHLIDNLSTLSSILFHNESSTVEFLLYPCSRLAAS